MGNGITELVFILDRSGSMHGLEGDTISGFNSMIEKQRGEPGKALVSTVLFDQVSFVLHDRIDLEKVPEMTEEEYFPRGSTALVDAIGCAIRHISRVHKEERPENVPEKTLFVITTDGMENASRMYSAGEVRGMIERRKARGWEFLFIGANIDAVETGARFGISRDRVSAYRADRRGTGILYDAMSGAIRRVRRSEDLSDDWNRALEDDLKERK